MSPRFERDGLRGGGPGNDDMIDYEKMIAASSKIRPINSFKDIISKTIEVADQFVPLVLAYERNQRQNRIVYDDYLWKFQGTNRT